MDSVHHSSQAPTTALPADVVSAINTLHDFVAAATSIPPQVVVTCRDEKRAFGRAALQAMSYRASALKLLVQLCSCSDTIPESSRYVYHQICH